MGSPSRNVQYHPPRLSEDRLNLPQPHSPSLPTHCSGKSGMRPRRRGLPARPRVLSRGGRAPSGVVRRGRAGRKEMGSLAQTATCIAYLPSGSISVHSAFRSRQQHDDIYTHVQQHAQERRCQPEPEHDPRRAHRPAATGIADPIAENRQPATETTNAQLQPALLRHNPRPRSKPAPRPTADRVRRPQPGHDPDPGRRPRPHSRVPGALSPRGCGPLPLPHIPHPGCTTQQRTRTATAGWTRTYRMRVKLLCGEEAATVLLVYLARLSEYGRALDTLRPACLRGRHRRTARPVDLLDNATHARHEISISGCTTESYRAKRRAKRTCTPRPRISAIEVIRAARKQRLEASSDTPTTTPVCPTSSSRTPVTYQASDRADDRPDTEPSDRPPQLQGASRSPSQSGPRTHGRVKPRTDQTASSRRPPPAHRVPRLRRSARISSAARSRTASSDTAQSIHSGATRHSRHGVGAGLQVNSTPSLPQPYRDGQALPHASSRTTGDRKASSCTPEGFEQTRRTPATTPVRYPAGHPVTHMSSDRPSGRPVPTPSRPPDRRNSREHPEAQAIRAPNARPRQTARRTDGVEQTTAARASSPRARSRACYEVLESARPPDHGPYRGDTRNQPSA